MNIFLFRVEKDGIGAYNWLSTHIKGIKKHVPEHVLEDGWLFAMRHPVHLFKYFKGFINLMRGLGFEIVCYEAPESVCKELESSLWVFDSKLSKRLDSKDLATVASEFKLNELAYN